MFAAAQGGRLLAHVHFEVGEKINVLAGGEGHEGADGPHDGTVQDDLHSTVHQRRLTHHRRHLPDVEHHLARQLVRRATVRATLPEQLVARRVVDDVIGNAVLEPRDVNVAKLVPAAHGVVIEHAAGAEEARVHLVGEHSEAVLESVVLDVDEPLGHVADDDAVTGDMDLGDHRR